jgi:predicted glycoside hydrolase/deacetylase ChbG (UPF0249 family)
MRIVVNADDFGFSPDTVRATIRCFEQGAVTSVTIMPRMPATDAALEYAVAHPELDAGVHLTFVGDGIERAVAPPDEIPALVDAAGRFPRTRDVRVRAMLHRLPVAQIEREVAAQIEAVQSAGVTVTHVDSHRHLHKFAPFRAALQRVLPRFGITRVRNVQDIYLSPNYRSPTYWLGKSWRRRLMREFETTDHFFMPWGAGDREPTAVLRHLQGLPGESLEIGAHPGEDIGWRRDEAALLEGLIVGLRERGHDLVPWSEIGHG